MENGSELWKLNITNKSIHPLIETWCFTVTETYEEIVASLHSELSTQERQLIPKTNKQAVALNNKFGIRDTPGPQKMLTKKIVNKVLFGENKWGTSQNQYT